MSTSVFRGDYQFIIKREFADGKDSWSLKRLHWYSEKSVDRKSVV